jgi:hypothetical protein
MRWTACLVHLMRGERRDKGMDACRGGWVIGGGRVGAGGGYVDEGVGESG